MSVSLEHPLVLLLCPAVLAALLLIHRRSTRPRLLEVSSIALWGPAAPGRQGERGKRTLSLRFWIQLAALWLLAAGVAGIAVERVGEEGRHLLLLLDTSASMQAQEGGSTRFALARAEARRLVATLGPRDRAALVSFSCRPLVEQPWTGDRRRLLGALGRVQALDTPTDLDAALVMARTLIREAGGRGEAIVLTDQPAPAFRRDWPEGTALRTVRVGRSKENLAITDLRLIQGPFLSLRAGMAYVTVRNFSPSSRRAVLAARAGGEEIYRWEAMLRPDESRVFELRGFPRAGMVHFELAGPDDLPADDQASVWVPSRKRVGTLVVSDDAAFARTVSRILAATDAFSVERAAPGGDVERLAAGHDLAIFHRRGPAGWPKPALVIAPARGTALLAVGAEIAGVRAVDWDPSHPLARHLQFPLSPSPMRAARLTPAFPARAFLSAATAGGDVPIAWAGEQGGRRLVVLGFDLAGLDLTAEENLPLLVLFLNSLAWLDPAGGGAAAAVPTGYVLPPARQASYRLRTAPAGSPFPFARAGEYVFDTPGGPRRYLAYLQDPEESRIAARKREAVEAAGSEAPRPAPTSGVVGKRSLTPLLYATALALLAAEWALYYWRRWGFRE